MKYLVDAFAKLEKYDGADIPAAHENYERLASLLSNLDTCQPKDRRSNALPIWLAECFAYKFSVAQGGKALGGGAIEVSPNESRYVYGRFSQTESRPVKEMKEAVFDHLMARLSKYEEEWTFLYELTREFEDPTKKSRI